MLIWGAGLVGLAVLVLATRGWRSLATPTALLGGLASIAVGVVGLRADDDLSVRWALLPLGFAVVTLALVTIDLVRARRAR